MVWSCCSASLCSLCWRYDHPQTFSKLFWGFPTEINCWDWAHTVTYVTSPHTCRVFSPCLMDEVYSSSVKCKLCWALPLMETSWWFSPKQHSCLCLERAPGRFHWPEKYTRTHMISATVLTFIMFLASMLHLSTPDYSSLSLSTTLTVTFHLDWTSEHASGLSMTTILKSCYDGFGTQIIRAKNWTALSLLSEWTDPPDAHSLCSWRSVGTSECDPDHEREEPNSPQPGEPARVGEWRGYDRFSNRNYEEFYQW